MGAADFVQEMRWVGERLLLKLQRLPQAEPVEIVAFSVILLFTGQSGSRVLLGSSRHPGGETTVLAGVGWGGGGVVVRPWRSGSVSPGQRRGSRCPLGETRHFPWSQDMPQGWAGWCWDQRHPASCPRDEGTRAPGGGGGATGRRSGSSGRHGEPRVLLPGSGQRPSHPQRGFWGRGGRSFFPTSEPGASASPDLQAPCCCCCWWPVAAAALSAAAPSPGPGRPRCGL